jgi:hypothetical protein
MAPISTSTLALGAFYVLVSVSVLPTLSTALTSLSIPVTVSGSLSVTIAIAIATLGPLAFVAVFAVMTFVTCVLFFGGRGSGGVEERFNVET